MSTEAKRRGNARYLQQYQTRSVRIPVEAAPAIDARLQELGLSYNAYVLRLISADLGQKITMKKGDRGSGTGDTGGD